MIAWRNPSARSSRFHENVLKELKASSFQPSSNSIEALRDYNQGIALQRDGKNLEAQKQFEAATKEDPNFRARIFPAGADLQQSGL